MTDYRPCPICHGTNSGECLACRGEGRFPFPWILPEDNQHQKVFWTMDEVDVIADAPTYQEAFSRYCSVYGPWERSMSSVRHRWLKNCGTTYSWTDVEVDTIDEAADAEDAWRRFRFVHGTIRTERAVKAKWHRLRK